MGLAVFQIAANADDKNGTMFLANSPFPLSRR